MKKRGWIVLIAIVLAAAALFWYFRLRVSEKPVILQTEMPLYGYIAKSVTATGTIEPVDTVTVGTQVSGTLKFIYADFNSKVKKGQLIAQLDQSLLQALVNQYKANLEVAKSDLTYQKSNYDRQNLLFQTGAISKADYETATNTYNTARSNVASVQAQLDAANKNLSYSSIYSPVDGVVMTRNVGIGQTVAASFSTPTLFVIAKDITKMQVQGAIDQADIGNVKHSQRVTFTVDAYPDDVFTGSVQDIRLEPSVSANVVTYTTIISAPNDNLKLKPGMTANITVYTKEDTNALLISAKALKFKPDASLAAQFKIIALGTDSLAGQHARQHSSDSASRNRNDSTDVVKKTKATIWIKRGDSLVQKKIIAGLNDDTNVEVLYGITTEDEVVIGIQSAAGGKPATASAQRSPFVPQRPGSKPATPKKQ